ncbi:MAG: iron-containing alcohol dehydrogenase [Nitrospinae bacterium]|nr:iron-containing alcohol dehydrogenase [Nitrospinota bacterium]
MENFVYFNPTKILFGRGQVQNVGRETALHAKKALLLYGGGSIKKTGLYGAITASLKEQGVVYVEQGGIKPNPEIASVRQGVTTCRREGISFILAVGGGSVIDAAKAIAAGVDYDGDPWDFFDKKAVPKNPIPIGVVLTLSATGSEANGNAVVSNPSTHEKRPIYHPLLHPKFSILDPELTYTVSAEQTAYGAVDTLSHVYEQYFHHVESSPIQDGFCETIMRAVIANAPLAIENPADYNARANLMWASTLALNNLLGAGAKGDWASHMIEHELSAHYGIAHGAGLAIVFPAWMTHVYKANPARFRRFAEKVWDVDTGGMTGEQAAIAGIEAMKGFYRNNLRIGVTMKDYGMDGSKISVMAPSAMKFRSIGNFVTLTKEDIEEIYKKALG